MLWVQVKASERNSDQKALQNIVIRPKKYYRQDVGNYLKYWIKKKNWHRKLFAIKHTQCKKI